MANLLLRDLGVSNLGICLLSAALYLMGWSPINAISISCMAAIALLLIWGGALGFFMSSASFDFLSKLLGRRENGEEDTIQSARQQKVKAKEESKKELVSAGKGMIILSFIVLGELLLITLAYVFIS